jgi:hypothetical protein
MKPKLNFVEFLDYNLTDNSDDADGGRAGDPRQEI